MSRAPRMPKERIVRSTGSPASSTAMPSLHTSPSAWCTAPSAYERSVTGHKHLARPHVDLDPATRPAASWSSTRGAPGPGHGHVGPARARRSGRARPARRGPPAPRPSRPRAGRGATGGPGTSTSLDAYTGAQAAQPWPPGASRSAEPGEWPTRTTPVPSGRSATARGGRLGPRRTTSSRRHRTADRPPIVVGQRPRPGRDRAVALAAEGSPVGQRRRGHVRRADTNLRRARRRRAPPRSSAS